MVQINAEAQVVVEYMERRLATVSQRDQAGSAMQIDVISTS